MSKPPRSAKYTGRFRYKKEDILTGEVVEIGEFDEFTAPAPTPDEKKSNRRNFAILYLMEFYCLLDELGTKKMKVVKFILENIGYDNFLHMNAKEIAKKSGVSYFTVKETLRRLEAANLITREKRGAYLMLNPKLMNRKNAQGEGAIMVKYRAIQDTRKGEEKNAGRHDPKSNDSPQEEQEQAPPEQ